ncbi:MAG TPA: stage II sporulation protein R [Firmicutes bacterium]|nr:stage II sporulation protein R [Bacillota bacterium]HHY97812.1 stage II sporulation protein R [Bacillota bacterium]
MKIRVVTAALILFITLTLIILTYRPGTNSASDCAYTWDNLIRLHVVANSNLPHDQEVKLKVRDAVLEKAYDLFDEISSKEQAQRVLQQHLEEFSQAAAQVVNEQGDKYPVSAEIGRMHFPAKAYGDVFLPEGDYDALRIVLGKGQGANWWCILFPPLCFVDRNGDKKTAANSGSMRIGASPELNLEDLKLRFGTMVNTSGLQPRENLLIFSSKNLSRFMSPLTLFYHDLVISSVKHNK